MNSETIYSYGAWEFTIRVEPAATAEARGRGLGLGLGVELGFALFRPGLAVGLKPIGRRGF